MTGRWLTAGIAFLMLMVVLMPCPGSGEEALKDGDPLVLYLRKSGTPQEPSLKLYPAFYPENENHSTYVIPLGARGSGNDLVEMFMPRDPMDNSLKYRPNSSLMGSYSFHISAGISMNPQYAKYRINVIVEMDYERDGDFDPDDHIQFTVEGDADGRPHRVSGEYSVDINDYEPFHPEKGGRIKVSLVREDFANTTLKFYVGYRNKTSHFRLPYSRYSGEEIEDNDNDIRTVLIVLGVILVIILVSYLLYRIIGKDSDSDKGEEPGKRVKRNGHQRNH